MSMFDRAGESGRGRMANVVDGNLTFLAIIMTSVNEIFRELVFLFKFPFFHFILYLFPCDVTARSNDFGATMARISYA